MTESNLMKQVNVLLSTYNGERFLLEQLHSLYQQTYPKINIVVRDDGSSDSTLNILKKEVSEGKLVLLPANANVGPAASFLKLLEASGTAGFYAFCDQDDVWHPQKIEIAVEAISKMSPEIPVMYFSRVTYVDAENNVMKLSPLPKFVGFGNALVENVATGCTVVINKAAKDLIVRYLPKQCLMHDSWCYLLISCFGKVIFDPISHINYRQHSANTIGASMSTLQTIFRRFKRFRFDKNDHFKYTNQAEQFLNLYSDQLPSDKQELLQQFVDVGSSFKSRICLALSKHIWRQSVIDNIIVRILILINRF